MANHRLGAAVEIDSDHLACHQFLQGESLNETSVALQNLLAEADVPENDGIPCTKISPERGPHRAMEIAFPVLALFRHFNVTENQLNVYRTRILGLLGQVTCFRFSSHRNGQGNRWNDEPTTVSACRSVLAGAREMFMANFPLALPATQDGAGRLQ